MAKRHPWPYNILVTEPKGLLGGEPFGIRWRRLGDVLAEQDVLRDAEDLERGRKVREDAQEKARAKAAKVAPGLAARDARIIRAAKYHLDAGLSISATARLLAARKVAEQRSVSRIRAILSQAVKAKS